MVIQIGKYTLDGGGSCPEQYDVSEGDVEVGYLRLRHGEFRADWMEFGEVTVFEADDCEGDGRFSEGERLRYLTAAIEAIDTARVNRRLA